MWLVSTRAGGAGMDDIWVATRTSRGATWTTPTNLGELDSPLLDRGPTVFKDGLEMWFHSDRGGGSQLFYRTTRASSTSPWATPQLAGTPPLSPLGAIRAWISPCGLELYFQGNGGATMVDFFVARRTSTDEPFGPAQRVDELSSPAYDQDLRLSADRRHAYFSSRRSNGVNDELYEAAR